MEVKVKRKLHRKKKNRRGNPWNKKEAGKDWNEWNTQTI